MKSGKTPYSVLKILTKRFNEGADGYDKSLPKINQLRNWKKQNSGQFSCGNQEYDQVNRLINELQYTDAFMGDDKKAFVYGVKMGVGSDCDPLIVCFTSKHLLLNISKHIHHYAVFHIDGTYKLIKNRVPVIAYGRTDTNGQLHLISVAICSHENSETYQHFYRFISYFFLRIF